MDWITELKRQVEELEAENERLRNDNPILKREIERLWAALLELNGEKQHGHVQSGEDEFGKRGRNEPEKP